MKDQPTILDEKTRLSLTTNNIWAILVAIVLFTLSWANVTGQLQLLNQKMDFQTQLLQEHKAEEEKDITEIISSLNDAHKRLAILEGRMGVKSSDESASLQ